MDQDKQALNCPFCGKPAELRQPVMPTIEECLLAEPNARCSTVAERCLGRYLVCSLSEWNRRTPCPHIVTGREGTSYCRLAENDGLRIAAKHAVARISAWLENGGSAPEGVIFAVDGLDNTLKGRKEAEEV